MGAASHGFLLKNVRRNIPLPRVLRRFWIAIVLLTAVAWGISLFCKYALHWPYPYDWPLFDPGWHYSDFLIFSSYFPQLPHFPERYREHFAYPAPAAMIYQVFYMTTYPLYAFITVQLGAFIFISIAFTKALMRRGISLGTATAFVGTVLICSYPAVFALERGNIEACMWLVLVAGIWAYVQERWWLAAMLIGIAGSMKIYPIIFLGLLLAKRKYRQVVFGILVDLAANVVSLWILGPTIAIAYRSLRNGMNTFGSKFVGTLRPKEVGFDHALFSWIKRLEWHYYHFSSPTPFLIVAAVVGTVLFFWRIQYMPRINQVLALAVAMVMLPPISGDYTLLHLYIPFAMLTLYAVTLPRDGQRVRGMGFCFACFAVLFTPQSYLILHGVRFGGQLKALVLLALFIAALRYPFADAEKAQAAETGTEPAYLSSTRA